MEASRKPIHDPAVLKRMQVTADLFKTAQILMRQNLRRRHPEFSDADIEESLTRWRHTRPGAEYGDGVGRPVPKEEIDAWLTSRGF
jgi:hypothetical protein